MEPFTSDGNCPQCDLSGKNIRVYLNKGDLWECPECHLQLHTVDEEYLGIDKERGNGKLTTIEYDTRRMGTRILLKDSTFNGDRHLILDESELLDYLSLCNLKSSY
jgi:hypothetical protein